MHFKENRPTNTGAMLTTLPIFKRLSKNIVKIATVFSALQVIFDLRIKHFIKLIGLVIFSAAFVYLSTFTYSCTGRSYVHKNLAQQPFKCQYVDESTGWLS